MLAAFGTMAALSCASSARVAPRLPSLLLARYDTILDPGSIIFPGNVVECLESECELLFAQVRDASRFRVAVMRMQNSRVVSRQASGIVDSSGGDQYDPVAIRLEDGSILLAFHSDGTIRLRKSADDGISWSTVGTVRPDRARVSYAEAFLRRWEGGISLAYASFDMERRQSRAEVRWSTDNGETWSTPVDAGDMGSLDDGSRPSISPVDRYGKAFVAYSTKLPRESWVATKIQLVSFADRRVLNAPTTVATDSLVAPRVGTFPVAFSCDGVTYVAYTAWHRDGTGEIKVVRAPESSGAAHRQSVLLSRTGVNNGFGRLWLYRNRTQLQSVLVESRNQNNAQITRTVMGTDSSDCVP